MYSSRQQPQQEQEQEQEQQQTQTQKQKRKQEIAEPTQKRNRSDASDVKPSRKERKRATISRVVQDGDVGFSFKRDVQTGPMVKAKMTSIIPLHIIGERPVLIQLDGGGNIPSFGLDQNEDKPNKYNVVINIGSDKEYESLNLVRTDLIDLVLSKWSSWFPEQKKPSDELIREQSNPVVSIRKRKQNSDALWPGTIKSAVDRSDVETGICRLVDQDGHRLELSDLPGMRWTKAVIEIRSIYILSNRSYGISKRLRYIECAESDEMEEIIPL
jgi:hypothetical protein